MPLTTEQMAAMEAAAGFTTGSNLSPDVMSQMEAAAGFTVAPNMSSSTANNMPEPMPEQSIIDTRSGNIMNEVLNTASGAKPAMTLPWRAAKEVAGGVYDMGGEAVSAITPDFIEEPLKEYAGQAADYLMGTSGGQAISEGYQFAKEKAPNVVDVLEGAAMIGGLPPVATGVGKAGKAAEKAVNMKKVYPDAEAVKQKATDLFTKGKESGVNFTPTIMDDLYKTGQDMLPKGKLSQKLIKPDEADSFVTSLDEVLGENPTLNDFQDIDRHLGDRAHAAFSDNPPLSAKFTKLQASLRDSVENPKNVTGSGEGLAAHREATRLWSIQLKMQDIQRIIDDADLYAVPATAIRTGFRRIATTDKLKRGYTRKEQASIRRAAETGSLEGIIQTFGSKLTAIGGAVAGGLPGAALGMSVSGGGRIASEAIKKGKGGKVNRLLGERSGLVKKERRIDLSKLKPALIQAIKDGKTPKELMGFSAKEAKDIIKEVKSLPAHKP